MKIANLACLLSIFFMHENAFGGFRTGNMLKDDCDTFDRVFKGNSVNTDAIGFGRCVGYIEGVADAEKIISMTAKKPFCLPAGVVSGQLVDVVRLYLSKHPEDRHYEAESLVLLALIEAFPCK